jgi:hypothetical protein
MTKPITNAKQDRLLALIAFGFIALTFVTVSWLVLRKPFDHNECPIYVRACWDWWAGQGLYENNFGIDGFLYLPQFVLLYSPFAVLDPILKNAVGNQPIEILAIGDIAWRAVGVTLLMLGLWRAARAFAPEQPLALFNLLVFMSFPPAIASLRNGQANLHIAALMLLAAMDLSEKKWSRASLWLVVGFFIKPVMAVMILLAAVGYWKTIGRLAVGLVVGAFLPFAFQKPHYVARQFSSFIRITLASSTPDREFCNLHGLLARFGLSVAPTHFKFLALATAGATLAIWLMAFRRDEPFRAMFLYALSAGYVLLFNFRTESNSYVMLAPAVGIAAAMALYRFHEAAVGWLLIAIALCLICDAWGYHWTENWLKPLACIIFLLLVTFQILRNRKSKTPAEPLPAPSLVHV